MDETTMRPPIRGRDADLALIGQRLADVCAGRGGVVLIEGAPGFGKTRILQETVHRATGMGISSGQGMADPLDQVVDLAPLLEALFDSDPPLLNKKDLNVVHAAPEQRFWLLHDLETLLEQAALDRPLLICLDDLHWADNGTAAALRTLPRRLGALPILWFLAARPSQGSAQIRAALAELSAGRVDRLELGPLSDAAVAEIVRDILDAEPDTDVLRGAEQTQGNPFLLLELVRGLEAEKIVSVNSGRARMVAERLPDRVSKDMRARLARMPEVAERAAVAAASLGRRFTVQDLAAMTDLSVTQLLPVIGTIIDAAIFTEYDDRLMFEHDLVRDAVRRSVPRSWRRASDRRGADVLLARGALPIEVAAQLAGSAEPGDFAAISTLADAAEALSVTDPAAAAELAERTLRLAPSDHPRRGPLVARRAIDLFAAGLAEEAKKFADTALGQALLPEQEARVRLSIASMFDLSPDVRLENAQRALALPGLPADLRAWLEALAFHNTLVAVRTDRAMEVVDHVRNIVDQSTSTEARFAFELAHAGLQYQLCAFEPALNHLDRASHLGTTENVRARLAHYFRCWPLVALDRFDESRAVAVAGMADAQRDRQNWALHIFETWMGVQALQAGRLADSAVALEGRFTPAEAQSVVGIIDAASVGALGRLKIHQGDERGASDVAQICRVMLDTTAPGIRAHAAWYLASYAISRADMDGARWAVRALGDDERLSIFPLFPHDVWIDPQVMRLALSLGDDDLAAHVLSLAERRFALNPHVRSIAAAAAHVRGLAQRSITDLTVAVQLGGRSGRPLALASALEDLGRQQVDDGAPGDAVDTLDRALAIHIQVGAHWDAARVRRRLREMGVRRRLPSVEAPRSGWAALTAAEAAVADLVCEGRTNRQIGEQLFVSPHTVSTHLRHIFEKLGVNSRVELTRLAVDRQRREPATPLRPERR
jgi:DNA-binding CsgD family transcriptional regulator